jgi:hypothetical protein
MFDGQAASPEEQAFIMELKRRQREELINMEGNNALVMDELEEDEEDE